MNGNPRTWWLSLKNKTKMLSFENNTAHLHICKLAPSDVTDVWFIIDEDHDEKLVLSVNINLIPRILEECRFFEYYV